MADPPTMSPVAIIGMAAVFPEARTLGEYWRNIVSGRDCIVDVPASRWSIEDYYDPDPAAPDKTYCKRGGFIPDVAFDPLEFGLPPNILDVTDTSQLLALVVAKEALEDAGYGTDREYDRQRTGVILGVGGGQKLVTPLGSRLQYPIWERALAAHGLPEDAIRSIVQTIKLAHVPWEEQSFPGMLGNVVAGRVANRLDLGGINCVVDAACASSLSAVQMAIGELHAGRSDMILTGGVDADNSISMYMCFSKTPAFSRRENVRPFDAESDGMMVGEGIGMLVLKRLADAERDGDRIYAVISGVGAASDGRHKSIYAPNTTGQELAIRRAQEAAGVRPADIGLIEAHGTGTVAGDLVEATTLVRVFGEKAPGGRGVALGSVKSQIGHTKAAAGAAGLIKAALAVHQKVLPPTINVDRPHPDFGLERSPIYLNTQARPWMRPLGDGVRRAGVSSFGFGGTNFHVILEEHGGELAGADRLHGAAETILLWRDSPADLLAEAGSLMESLGGGSGEAAFAGLVAASQDVEIPAGAARVGFVAASADEAREMLGLVVDGLGADPARATWEHPRGAWYRRIAADTGRVVALFPGQGSQYVGMGREIALSFPVVRETFAAFDQRFAAEDRSPLSELVYPPQAFEAETRTAQEETLRRTEHAQPAIGAISAALYKLMQSAGFQADMVAGHSFGELTALWAAGALDDEAFVSAAVARGRMMAPQRDAAVDAGAMLAVRADAERVRAEIRSLPDVMVANENSDRQVVLGGPTHAVAEARTLLEARGLSVVPLPVSAAFHTPLVSHAQRPFAAALDTIPFGAPRVPVYANATARPYPAEPAAIRAQLADQMLRSVQFRGQIENIYAAGGRVFVEVGPRAVLTNLVNEILGDRPHLAVSLNAAPARDADLQLRQAVAQLRVAGVALGRIDPYRAQPARTPGRRRSAATVMLGGNNYVSERRKIAFAAALAGAPDVMETAAARPRDIPAEGRAMPADTAHEIVLAAPGQQNGHAMTTRNGSNGNAPTHGTTVLLPAADRPVETQPGVANGSHDVRSAQREQAVPPAEPELPAAAAPTGPGSASGMADRAPAPQVAPAVAPSAPTVDGPSLVESLRSTVAAFSQHQAESLRVHDQFLQVQAEYTRAFVGLAQQQQALLLSGAAAGAPPAVLEALMSSMARFHDHQGETLRVHDRLLSDQTSLTRAIFEAQRDGFRVELGATATPPAHSAIPAPPRPVQAQPQVTPHVASPAPTSSHGATAVPASIPTLQPTIPTLPPTTQAMPAPDSVVPPPSAPEPPVAEPPTPVVSAPAAPRPQPVEASAPSPVPVSAPVSVEEFTEVLLAVVSEKTGYPAETLELDMSMEADLGIDSIKRVEILGAMRQRFPDSAPIKPADLAELRTLGEIVAFLSSTGAAGTPAAETDERTIAHDATTISPGGAPAVPSRAVRLKPLPPPDWLDDAFASPGLCLLTDDGTPLTAHLAGLLAKRGRAVAVLAFPPTLVGPGVPLPPGVERIALPDLDEVRLPDLVASLTARYGSIALFVHLSPPQGTSGNLFPADEAALVRHVFLLARHLQRPLAEAAARGGAGFATVTRLDGLLGHGGDGAYGAVAGGLYGLVKSLNAEWDAVRCRAVDLAPTLDADAAAALVLAELHDPDRLIVEVGLGAHGRVTLAGA